MRERDIPAGYIAVTNIPKAIIKPAGKTGNKASYVLYACSESESGYASIKFDNSAFKPVEGNDNVMDLLVSKYSKLIRSTKKDGKYVTDRIEPWEFKNAFEATHSEYSKNARVEAGRSLVSDVRPTGHEGPSIV